MNKPRVYLTGGDGKGWALDEDLSLTKKALEGLAEFSSLEDAEIVHSMWFETFLHLPQQALAGKRSICHMPGEPRRYFALPRHRLAMPLVTHWVTHSQQAQEQLRAFGVASTLIPYTVDITVFRPMPRESPELAACQKHWSLPENCYLIGSFQRDSEGDDLTRPKLVKGPDILAEIGRLLVKKGLPVHFVLAGPRRHWLRQKLSEYSVPFTFLGEITACDDVGSNCLPKTTLNLLYNLLDLYIVASRSEGGPRAILEAAAARCPIISTRVGQAPDVLEPSCLFQNPIEAVAIIARDLAEKHLRSLSAIHQARVNQRHIPEAARELFADLYERVRNLPPLAPENKRRPDMPARKADVWRKACAWLWDRISRKPPRLRVSFWHNFHPPPYGGGNQFLFALRKALTRRSVEVVENRLDRLVDCHLLNSIHFNVEKFIAYAERRPLRILHRIDGPIHLIRGYDREKDELCLEINQRLAFATVIQSAWTYQKIVEMGKNPKNATIIHNAVDPDVFHAKGRLPLARNRKIRLIATSWSGNPRKGGQTYAWLDKNLDFARFELTFVGNLSEPLSRAQHIPPVASEQLADILRQHDIYITASRNDPCSNAVLEAMACGLPVLYYNDGGHPEIVGQGGLPFTSDEEILRQLEIMLENYETFQNLLRPPTLDDVADRYLELLQACAQGD